MLTNQQKIDLCAYIDNEGVEFTLTEVSWDEVKDKKFQNLLSKYKRITKEIEEYIGYPEYKKGELILE